MKLIVSTTGIAKPKYHDMSSTPDIPVCKVEDISYGKIMGDPETNRDYAYIELTPEQALGVALDILTKLSLDEGAVKSWNVSFPEREEPKSEWQPYADGPADTERAIGTLPAPVYEVPEWNLLGIGQRIACGKQGIVYIQDSKHAAWIRREAKKRGLKASVFLSPGVATVRLTRP